MNTNLTGPEYWRSLEQLAESDAGWSAMRTLQDEFPGYDPAEMVSRRRFMKFMGASLALAGLTLSGCRRWPKEKLAPYSANPRDRVPGVLEQYATVMELGGVAMGLLATSFGGRPIKIEGNPLHPYSKTLSAPHAGRLSGVPGEGKSAGAADAFAQASVLELYDPDRSRSVVRREREGARPGSWEEFSTFAATHFARLRGSKGEGFAILSEATASPSVMDMKRRLMEIYPQAKWYEYEPLTRDNEIAGTKLAFGKAVRPVLHLDKAQTVVLFDADVLGTHPAHVRYSADWVTRRRTADQGEMSRVYIAETCFSATGAVADERLGVGPSRMGAIVAAVAEAVGVSGSGFRVPGSGSRAPEPETAFVEAAVADLKKGQGVVAAGSHLPAEVQAMVHAINEAIGAAGVTVTYVEEPDGERLSHAEAIKELAERMKAGQVKTLLMLGGNPVYDAPADVGFAAALANVPVSVHLSLYDNETSMACAWHLPRAHYLEAWGDGRAWDGTPSVAQPLIQPLYGGKSAIEVLGMVIGEQIDGEQIVRRTWEKWAGDEIAWRRVLHDGVLVDNEVRSVGVKMVGQAPPYKGEEASGFEVRFLQGSAYDGRFANSGWLQELPDVLTKLVWDNAALVAKKDADALGVTTGDMVRISAGATTLEIVAYVLPGQPAGVIGLPLGYGRGAAGNVGNGVGVDTYRLRTTGGMWLAGGVKVEKTGRSYPLAMTQDHHIIDRLGAEARAERAGEMHKSGKIIREATLAAYKEDPQFVNRNEEGGLSLQIFEPPRKFNDPHAWGMAVDMSSCVGCNACVVACQAENNIPVVGKEQVMKSREMHWIRIDRYFKGPADAPEVVYQPVMCQHCENAPCEQVCPVGATMHDTEGLNAMVYNRCIGTRYCSNNCPYKVRRFNYADFHSQDPRGTILKPWLGMPDTQQQETVDRIKRMVFNPDVTVRMRGVMEKCTYCVQRIHEAQTAKRNRGESVQDGDILTACQQTCPTQAIVFGDLNDPNSKVSQLQRNNRAYGLLDELNTRPRTKYLAKVSNPVL
jgi:molybdopterin-containing oxidoreductase family iron-sulfur binding subunit